jgi:hypothetical protein
MNQTIVYVGLDVDDTQYHGSALNKNTGEVTSRPIKVLLAIRLCSPNHAVSKRNSREDIFRNVLCRNRIISKDF